MTDVPDDDSDSRFRSEVAGEPLKLVADLVFTGLAGPDLAVIAQVAMHRNDHAAVWLAVFDHDQIAPAVGVRRASRVDDYPVSRCVDRSSGLVANVLADMIPPARNVLAEVIVRSTLREAGLLVAVSGLTGLGK